MGDFVFYGDESTGPEGAYAVAGYVASVGQWESFRKQWKLFAEEEGFTVLHKRLLEHNVKGSEFEWPGLSRPEKQEKKKRINQRACQIILDHALAGVGMAVQRSEWEQSVSRNKGIWSEYIGRSFYAVGVFGCVTFMEDVFTAKRRVGMVRYVFADKKKDGRGEAEDILRKMKADPYTRDKFHIGGYSFEAANDPCFSPLQAADFLAYESYRQIEAQILHSGTKLTSSGQRIPPRGALRGLLRADDPRYASVHPEKLPVPHFGGWINAQLIKDMATHMTEMLRPFEN